MLVKKILFVFIFILIRVSAFCQAIDNSASFRIINADKYIRIHYENDFFTGTDLYYTQGINLEFVNPSYKRFPVSKVLIVPKNATTLYGIALEHNGYTPSSITHDNILYGDRPFAAALLLKTFSASNNPNKHYRITSSLSLGVVGKAASGYWMQKTIHRWVNGTPPQGWQNQIKNDAIVNYEAGVEKNILSSGNYFLINAFANARLGTFNDKFSSGVVIMAGKLNSAITSVFRATKNAGEFNQKDKFSFHIYFQPMINIVGYDATMQGGLFNHSSPYTISANQIERITIQGNYGVVVNIRSIYLEYFQSVISKEFETGVNHRWGGIRLGVLF